jgi:DNA repair protein RadC
MGGHYMELKVRTKEAITSPEQVAEIFETIQKTENEIDRMKEKCWVVGLNTRNFIVYVELVSLGTLNSSLVHPREVFRFAIIKAVSGIILVHNHPSGDMNPSDDDLSLTRRLYDAGKILGIDLHDHIIIADGSGYTSLKGNGII